MSTSVKYFHADLAGAPTLNNAAGSLINVLDACLVDGFGLKSLDSLVVASGIATATVSAGLAGYEADVVALIAGSGITALNGEKRLLSATATTVTFAAPGVADGAASGTITMKIAPVGWAKPYSASNVAVYRSTDVLGTRMHLRVDDTGAAVSTARVVGYETMTDAHTGTGPFPTNAQYSGGLYWPKVDADDATSRKWLVVADSRALYLVVRSAADADWQWGGGFVGFGDFASRKAGDAYACYLSGSRSDCATPGGSDPSLSMMYSRASLATVPGLYAPRSFTGVGASVPLGRRAQSYSYSDTYSGAADGGYGPGYPNPADNSLLLSPVILLEGAPLALRGSCRGLYYIGQDVRSALYHRDKMEGQGALLGRKLLAVRGYGYARPGSDAGVALLDITGPWA
ncbi:MAG: hypothetical protein ACT4NV_02960 [Rhodoferax sp.]